MEIVTVIKCHQWHITGESGVFYHGWPSADYLPVIDLISYPKDGKGCAVIATTLR